jgi:hypothetical protein
MPHTFYHGPGLLAAVHATAALGTADSMIEWRYTDLEARVYGDAVLPAAGQTWCRRGPGSAPTRTLRCSAATAAGSGGREASRRPVAAVSGPAMPPVQGPMAAHYEPGGALPGPGGQGSTGPTGRHRAGHDREEF